MAAAIELAGDTDTKLFGRAPATATTSRALAVVVNDPERVLLEVVEVEEIAVPVIGGGVIMRYWGIDPPA
jgi:hypothetical protein